MSTITGKFCCGKKFTYQHIQGVMLVNLNKLAFKLTLSHQEYRVIATLISFWNIKTASANPSLELIATYCQMSKKTALNYLNKLSNSGLISISKTPGQNNNYNFSELIYGHNAKPLTSEPCKTSLVLKHNKLNKITSSQSWQYAKTTMMLQYKKFTRDNCWKQPIYSILKHLMAKIQNMKRREVVNSPIVIVNRQIDCFNHLH